MLVFGEECPPLVVVPADWDVQGRLPLRDKSDQQRQYIFFELNSFLYYLATGPRTERWNPNR